jgi:hypothetical protein
MNSAQNADVKHKSTTTPNYAIAAANKQPHHYQTGARSQNSAGIKMKNSPKLSYGDYRTACNNAFTVNMHNPTVYYNPGDGFYVAPSSDLVPNEDTVISLAYYSANTGARSLTGSRREYAPIAHAIREFFSRDFKPVQQTVTLKNLIEMYNRDEVIE